MPTLSYNQGTRLKFDDEEGDAEVEADPDLEAEAYDQLGTDEDEDESEDEDEDEGEGESEDESGHSEEDGSEEESTQSQISSAEDSEDDDEDSFTPLANFTFSHPDDEYVHLITNNDYKQISHNIVHNNNLTREPLAYPQVCSVVHMRRPHVTVTIPMVMAMAMRIRVASLKAHTAGASDGSGWIENENSNQVFRVFFQTLPQQSSPVEELAISTQGVSIHILLPSINTPPPNISTPSPSINIPRPNNKDGNEDASVKDRIHGPRKVVSTIRW